MDEPLGVFGGVEKRPAGRRGQVGLEEAAYSRLFEFNQLFGVAAQCGTGAVEERARHPRLVVLPHLGLATCEENGSY